MNPSVSIPLPDATLILHPIHDHAIRVRCLPHGAREERPSLTLVSPQSPAFSSRETDGTIEVKTSHVTAVFHKDTASLTFRDASGRTLLEEIPGTRRTKPNPLHGEPCYEVEQSFASPSGEQLHGLGQFQDGHFNLRGIPRRLIQVNTQIAIPFLLSSQGWGLLWHQAGLTDFNPADHAVALEKDPGEGPESSITVTGSTGAFTEKFRESTYRGRIHVPEAGEYGFFLDYGGMTNRHAMKIDGVTVIAQENFWLPPSVGARVTLAAGPHDVEIVSTKGGPSLAWRRVDDRSVFRSPHADALDYVVFAGPEPRDIVASFRSVSGGTPMLPRWAFGFWQCRERYTTQAELLENARAYRERRLPVDVMVQDWQYWPKDQWAGMEFDPARYPDPPAMLRELKAMNLRLVLSVWENVSKDSDLGRAYEAGGHYVPDSPWIDMTRPATRTAHWQAMRDRLASLGIDGWWLDATEPENDALVGKRTHLGPGECHRLTYPLHVSQAVFDGERSDRPDRRPCILTRSAFPGQQRYNSITWSGDIGWDWDAFRRQIVAGLNYCASGLPYWTTDIGGFFRPVDQYNDPAYREILTRWFQFGAFCPVFRLHGFGSETEVWRYGPEFEQSARAMLELRYRLMPYLYSAAWQVTTEGATLMRPLLMDFPHDAGALEARHQFLFGPAFLVAPVTEPGVDTWPVWLPAGTKWFDFWSGEVFEGGWEIRVPLTRDRIPLFVRAGSIVVMGPQSSSTAEGACGPHEIRVYPGADGTSTVYEDAGDGWGYEHGEHSRRRLTWNDAARTLTIGPRLGEYPGKPERIPLRIQRVATGMGGIDPLPGGFEPSDPETEQTLSL